jgi:hypothetical protein
MPLCVLITNICLAGRTGTEVVAEQLADALVARGHRVALFAQLLGPLAAQLRARGHVVTDRPGALPFRPDVIHGHHTAPTLAAIAAWPGVPALFVCHSAGAAFDAAPLHPAIRRLFAVDLLCEARLRREGAEAVALLRNAVDLSRIPPRAAPLPARPLRAVALTKHSAHLRTLQRAAARHGLSFEAWGQGAGRLTEAPEALFAGADLVFATARSAMEAAAAGAAVVVADARGCAGFLTARQAEAWLPWNLGAGVLDKPADLANLDAAIAAYDPQEAAAASALVRARHDLADWIPEVEAIHAALAAEPAPVDAAAVGAFLATHVPHFGHDPWRGLAAEFLPPPPAWLLAARRHAPAWLRAVFRRIVRSG